MRNFATADCETNPFKFNAIIKPFIWGFYTGKEFLYFRETADFVEHIKNYKGIIYFHNGGKFDIHFLLDYVDEQESIMIINGRIAKIKIGEAELRDSYLLLPVPLSAYQKDEIDYNKFEENVREKHMAEICQYLESDCVYLYQILEKQFEEYGQKLTLASSAFDFWHKNFSEYKEKPSTSRDYFETFKPFYYGGRVQCFKKGIINKEFQVYDINSAYPYAMQFEHPYGDECIIDDELPEREYMGLSFIEFYGTSKGALPFRDKSGLFFPNDDEIRLYKVTGWELQTAIDLNKVEISRIERVYTFTQSINFSGYVNHFFDLKAKLKGVDEGKYLLSKLYLNSLYGKFGQSSIDHREFALISPEFIEGYLNAGYEFEAEIGKYALMSTEIEEYKQRFYNVATAASITGFVRSYLFKHINSAKEPIYCDTDSLACVGFNGEIGKELGQWEKEGDFSEGAIGGKKLYAFKYSVAKKNKNYKISSKGAKLTHKQIFAIAKGNTIIYKKDSPTFTIGKEPKYITRTIKLT